jgi:hypothetical protein
MSFISWISEWLQSKAPSPHDASTPNIAAAPEDSSETDEFYRWITRQPIPPITFNAITDVGAPPSNEQVSAGVFYKVARNDQAKWALFLCPCGCGDVITLSLQTAHHPRWQEYPSKDSRPTLRPSVWRDVGCFSHFILQDGRIYWCNDTGISPDVVRKRFHRIA